MALHAGTSFAQKPAVCRVAVIEGEVRAGQTFERPIGNGLEAKLEALASGWIIRVVPVQGPPDKHDYAELATPPYRSVSPLLVSTDFSFRAQDALAWNPRHFRFALDRGSFLELEHLYDEYERDADKPEARRSVESRLARVASRAAEADFTILDAHLVQGTADQAGTAAMVASHLNTSAHEVDQPVDGKTTPLGRLNSVRFRMRLQLPAGFAASAGISVKRGTCL